MIKTKAIFTRKENKFEPHDCVINAVEILSEKDYKEFCNNMLADRDYIKRHIDDMFVDENRITHGLLILGEESNDGILIDSSGYSYARYVAFLPNIKQHFEKQIKEIVDEIIKNGTQSTESGSWTVYFEELDEQYHVNVTPTNGIGTVILRELEKRDEIAEVNLMDDGFDLTFYLDYCTNLSEEDDELSPDEEKEEYIRVLKIEPQKAPEVVMLKNTYEGLQEAVGGLFQFVPLTETVEIMCNEEGKLLGLEGNRSLGNDILVGTFYVTGSDYEGNLCSLSDTEIEEYTNRFLKIETFSQEDIEDTMGYTIIAF